MFKIFDAPFMLCVKFLQWLGQTLGLTYQEISVIFNLWIQGGVLLITAFLPMLCYVFKHGISLSVGFIAAVDYALINMFGFATMLYHYRLPINRAFMLCVEDLQKLASLCHTTYNAVNIVIFVIMYLVLLAVNCVWAYFVYL